MRPSSHDTLIAFRANEELRDAIREGARDEGVTSSEFMRRLIRARERVAKAEREDA